jgi:AraC-like DNA-binding protein
MTFLESDREAALWCLSAASALLGSDRSHPDVSTSPASDTLRPRSLARWQTKRTLAYIEANLGSKMALSDLADVVAFSKSHFSRAFKQRNRSFRRLVGVSPGLWRRNNVAMVDTTA